MLERGEPVAYLDFKKAFDSVPHKRLISKMHGMGIRGQLLHWIETFLLNRRQCVVVNGEKSAWAHVASGIPQGTVLGPTLFLLFVNDLPDAVKCHVKLFADDAKIYTEVGSSAGTDLLQDDLDALVEWSLRWKLPFNTDKCSMLHLGSGNERHKYLMQGTPLEQSSVEKDLGVLIDEQLKFRQHAAAAVAKANQILGLVKHSFAHLDAKTLPLLYKTLVRPHLEYGNALWGPFNAADRKLVERVQRRATRILPDLRHLTYEDRLKALKLPSLQYRRLRGDMILMFWTVG